MLVSRRSTTMLLEAVDRVGIDVDELLADVGLDRAGLIGGKGVVAWSTTTQILTRLSEMVGHDPERLRDVGRAMTSTTTYEPLRRIARSAISVDRLYRLTIEWVGSANFPHLRARTSFQQGGRLVVHLGIPEAYPASQAFFHVSEGAFTTLSTLLGLPPARIVESRVTPRAMDLVVLLPESRRGLRAGFKSMLARATQRARHIVEVLEEERGLLAEGLEVVQRAHREQRMLLERLPDMVVVDVRGKIVFANGAFVRTLGWSNVEELIGMPLLELVDWRSHAAFDELESSPPAQRTPQLTRASLLRRDGTPVLIEIAPPQSVVFDGEDARLVVGRDIEERVRLQDQLAMADRLASLGLLAAGVAHEVNNPLAYVLNNIEMAQRQLAQLGPSAEAPLQALTVALEGVDRIRFIVRELLLLSRSERDAVGPVDVDAVITSTLSLARPTVMRVATLVTELEPAPHAQANASRVAQIVLNLVLNAIEAMRDTEPEKNVLTVRLGTSNDGLVVIEVTDTGGGIDERNLERIFEPFYTTKPAGMGTGLGLSITQRLVVELGGHIEVTSALGRGSTFRVTLPATHADERDEHDEHDEHEHTTGNAMPPPSPAPLAAAASR